MGSYAGKVTLIDTRTRKATAHIAVGAYPVAAVYPATAAATG